MKKTALLLIVLYIIPLTAQVKIEENEIEPGVIHKKIINTKDTLCINILKINLSAGNYFLQSVKAGNKLNSKETTSEMVKALSDSGYKVVAAINADFFENDGEVINNMISGGAIVKAVKFTDSPYNLFVNSQFATTFDNKLLLDQFVFTGSVILPDGSIEKISRINSIADSNSLTIYNNYQGTFTPETPDHWFKIEYVLKPVEINGDTLLFVVDKISKNKNTEIINEEIILSANNGYAFYVERELSLYDTIGVIMQFNPGYKFHKPIRTLIGGWPRIVVDGKNSVIINKKTEGVFPRFSETKHPRTGIGFSRDSTTVYFITVDGRQESSSGMSLEKFADFMISESIYQGLNLDGGGSTTMIINNEVVNKPSDLSGEREVGNCIMLIKKTE